MAVRLLVKSRSEQGGAEKGQEVVLDTEVILIGRDKSCQLVLASQAVSRNHARISRDGALFFIEDLGSAYGTQINGEKLPKGEKRLLRNGDNLSIAQFDVTFDRLADVPKDLPPDKTSFVARAVVKDVMRGLAASEGPYFRVMNGPKEGQRIELHEGKELVVGREEGVDIVLKDDLVSRRHVLIRRDWSGTHVEDLGSRNGIRINKKRSTRITTLKDRDEVEVGGIRLLYLDPSEVREAPVVLAEEGESTEAEKVPKRNAKGGKSEPKEEEPPPEEPEAEEAPPEEPAEEGAGESGEEGESSEASGSGEVSEVSGGGENSEVSTAAQEGDGSEGDGSEGEEGGEVERSPLQRYVPLAVVGLITVSFLVVLILVLAGA